MKITSPISSGELIDKLSILHIKLEKIRDTKKLKAISKEHSLLQKLVDQHLTNYPECSVRFDELFAINLELWEVEDLLRKKESLKEFDEGFIELARQVYVLNDKRFAVKDKINTETGSSIGEKKSIRN
jgi:predicted nuclease with TOPRIM domain